MGFVQKMGRLGATCNLIYKEALFFFKLTSCRDICRHSSKRNKLCFVFQTFVIGFMHFQCNFEIRVYKNSLLYAAYRSFAYQK